MSSCILKRYTAYRSKGRATSTIVPLSDLVVSSEVFSQWVEVPREDTIEKILTVKGGIEDE